MKKKFLFFLMIFFCCNVFSRTGIMSGQKNVKIIKTKYFDIIYSENSLQTAKILYENADSLYEDLAEKLGLKNKFRLPVVISPAQDEFNAYFSCGPFNHIVIFDIVCTAELAVFSQETLNTFRHELTHAVTYNLRNDFWFGFDRIFGDVYNPALLTITQAWAEGASVSIESENGEGRLNSGYSLQMLKQAKIEGKFPKFSEIQGAMDVYPAGNASYLFGGAFCEWLQKKYGMQKYAEFWQRSVNLKTLTYFGCFKKVYGISIKKAWNDFFNELEVPEIFSEPAENPWIKNAGFKNPVSVYSSITSCGEDFFYYDKYKKTVNQVHSGKLKILHAQPNISRLAASKDGRFLVESYSSGAYAVPKNKVRIYDFQKKTFFVVPETSLRDASVVFSNGKYFLCAVKTASAFSTLKIYELEFKKDKICGIRLDFEKEFPVEQQIFSLEGNCSGELFYILKNKLEFSICGLDLNTKSERIFELPILESSGQKSPGEGISLRGLNYSSAGNIPLISFSFARKNEFPRLGILSLGENPEFKLLTQDVSGGIYFPAILTEEKAVFVANFFRGSKIYFAELSGAGFETFSAKEKIVKPEETGAGGTEDAEEIAENTENILSDNEFLARSERFSSIKYTFSGPHGTLLPLGAVSTYTNKNVSELDSVWLPLGATYVSSTPWTNPIWYVSAGYNFLTNSEGIKFCLAGNSSSTELFAYSGTGQVEFDADGYKQSFGNISFNSKIPVFGTSYFNFSVAGTILEGRQSETSISTEKKPKNLAGYFKVLKSSEDDFVFLNNIISAYFGNIHKSGSGYYDYSGIQVGATLNNSYFALADDFERNKSFDNLSFSFLARSAFLLPLAFEAALFPSEDYIAAAMAKIVLFNWEIQKSTNFLPLFYANRFTVTSYYAGKFEDSVDSWAVKEISSYFERIKNGKAEYTDELALNCAFSFTPNIGGLARNNFMFTISGGIKYRFFPAENQKRTGISVGIGSNLSL